MSNLSDKVNAYLRKSFFHFVVRGNEGKFINLQEDLEIDVHISREDPNPVIDLPFGKTLTKTPENVPGYIIFSDGEVISVSPFSAAKLQRKLDELGKKQKAA